MWLNPEDAARASLAFQAALVRLGAEVVAEVVALWRAGRGAGFAGDAAAPVEDARGYAFELGVAFYRLHRALHTGVTVPAPGARGGGRVELDRLRAEFMEVLPADLPGGVQYSPPAVSGSGVWVRVDVSPVFDVDEAVAEAEAAVGSFLDRLDDVSGELAGRLAEVDESAEREVASVVDAARAELVEAAGQRVAGDAARVARDGARGAVESAVLSDSQAIGWARVSGSGSPCGFCAMLMSREVAYKSAAAAGVRGGRARSVRGGRAREGELYHSNCNCYAEPVYSWDQYRSGDLFAANREFARAWPAVTRGKSGKDALNAWRTWVRNRA